MIIGAAMIARRLKLNIDESERPSDYRSLLARFFPGFNFRSRARQVTVDCSGNAIDACPSSNRRDFRLETRCESAIAEMEWTPHSRRGSGHD